MKKILSIALIFFILLPIYGCNKKSTDSFPSNIEIIQQSDFDDSNLIFLINSDIYKPIPVNMKIYFDEKLCLDSDSIRKNKATLSSTLNVSKTNHIITVVINDKVNSSLIIETTEEKQWIIVEYINPGVLYSISNEPPLFD